MKLPRIQNLYFLTASMMVMHMSAKAEVNVDVPPFYEIAQNLTPLPGAPIGQILRQEKLQKSIPNSQAFRIAYISSDLHNNKTIATGLIIIPEGPKPTKARAIVSWAHGTTGTAQNCGPSQMINPAVPLNQYFLDSGNSWNDYGIASLNEFIEAGYIVVATDYQGLGGGGAHHYAIAQTNARDTINAIRAARNMPEAQNANVGNSAVIYGWSQGGGAALAAAGMDTGDIQLKGVVAMAPQDISALLPEKPLTEKEAQKEMDKMIHLYSSNVFDFTHLTENLWATQAASGDKLKLTDVFTDDGANKIDNIMTGKCVHVAADTLHYTYKNDFTSVLNSTVKNANKWIESMRKGSVSDISPKPPVIIYFGEKDNVNSPTMGQTYQMRMCKKNKEVNIQRVDLGKEVDHFSTPAAAQSKYVQWIKDRFEGKPLKNGCETFR